ncbi:MAG TPA: hypothetical protein PKV84_01555 [Candidatus Omnitrophota bacterium]|nr:hypothetical protein [Candidatus Omnitrophota bacterium]
MGFDVVGNDPKTEKGEYFRNNVWWWHPLWGYVAKQCQDILTHKEIEAGGFNNGVLISERKAREIGLRLRFLLDQKEVKRFAEGYQKHLDAMPDERCDLCAGTGKRNDEFVKGDCNGCEGKGKKRPWAAHYPFNEENVKDFADFAIESGGFRIC